MSTVRRITFVVFLCGLVASVGVAQDRDPDDERQIRELIEKGLDDAMRGKLKEAMVSLEQALTKVAGVSADAEKIRLSGLIYAIIDRVQMHNIMKIMNDKETPLELRNTMERLILLSKPGVNVRPTPEQLALYLKYFKDPDAHVYMSGVYHLVQYGPHVVKSLIKELANEQDKSYRAKVMNLFQRIGHEVTHAVAEALRSKGDLMRENAAWTLGLIKDDRALPYLKRVVENPNEKTEVKKRAVEAVELISRKKVEELPSAKELFYNLALKYYYGHPSVLFPLYHTYFIWKWDTENEDLMERELERFALNEQMAEEACLNALEIDPNYDQAWSLLVNVLYAQEIETGIIIEAMEVEAKLEVPDAKEKLEELKKKFSAIDRMSVLANMASRKYLYLGLKRALEDDNGYGNFPIAAKILNAVKEMGKPEELPPRLLPPGSSPESYIAYPLVQALSHKGDKRIRYAASEVMVKFNPQEMKLGMGTSIHGPSDKIDLTVANLVDALGESGTRIALIIHENKSLEDQNYLNRLQRALSQLDVVVEFAHTPHQGLTKARFFPNKDMIIMQSKFHNELTFMETITRRGAIETVMDSFVTDARVKHTPLIILSDTAEEDAAMQKIYRDVPVDQGRFQFVVRPVRPEDIVMQAKNITEKAEAYNRDVQKTDTSADKAIDIAEGAAKTLAAIDPTNTLFPYRDAIMPLIKKLHPEPVLAPDRVRLPCVRALGRYGDVKAFDILTKLTDMVKEDEDQKRQLRLACIRAISNTLRLNDVRPPDPTLEILKQLIVTKDYKEEKDIFQFEMAASEAIGNAKLTNKERVELERFKQLKRWQSGQ